MLLKLLFTNSTLTGSLNMCFGQMNPCNKYFRLEFSYYNINSRIKLTDEMSINNLRIIFII